VNALATIHERLLATLGPQGWWPGDGQPATIIIGAVLTQNTAWSNVEKALANLHAAGVRTLGDVVACADGRLAELIRPSGYFNVKAKRLRAVAAYFEAKCGDDWRRLDEIPTESLRAELLAVHGIGPETADDILLYALGRAVFVIDAYTRRLMERHGLAQPGEPYEELRRRWESALGGDASRFNEGHALIVKLAKLWCHKRAPKCGECPLHAAEFFASRAALALWQQRDGTMAR